jgi:hypothetical protein
MLIYIDVDETICLTPENRDYSQAVPILENIKKANAYYDNGNTVVYWTARGSRTGIDWRALTEQQFRDWGVKYNELKFGKPSYDLFVDDKVLNTEDW